MGWVILGGALGAGCRYGVIQALAWLGLNQSPWPVMLVNIIGCFLFGLGSQMGLSTPGQLLLLTGVLGGFTTFSSYIHDGYGSGWVIATPVLGYVAYDAGIRLYPVFNR